MCGLAALTRAELVLLVPLLAIPAALGADRSAWRARVTTLVVVVVAAVLTMAPWVVCNLVTFDEPTLFSTSDGAVLLGANCDRTYSGRLLGVWSLECSTTVPETRDLSVSAKRQRDEGLDYIGDHLGRYPVVVAARIGRAFDVFRPFQTVDFGEREGRPREAAIAGLILYWLMVPFAIAGVVLLRRRRTRLWPFLVPISVVVIVVALGYGITRFRVPAEPSLVVLAAVGLVAAWRRWMSPRVQPGRRPVEHDRRELLELIRGAAAASPGA